MTIKQCPLGSVSTMGQDGIVDCTKSKAVLITSPLQKINNFATGGVHNEFKSSVGVFRKKFNSGDTVIFSFDLNMLKQLDGYRTNLPDTVDLSS